MSVTIKTKKGKITSFRATGEGARRLFMALGGKLPLRDGEASHEKQGDNIESQGNSNPVAPQTKESSHE